MEKGELPFLSATELSELIRTREVSPVETAEAYLERIDQLDGRLNSYVTVCREEALEAARDAEGAIARGGYLGPMHGIPVAVKDQFKTRGIRTTGGSRIFSDFIPDEDATVMVNLKRAGAVLLGKLNMSEFAMGEIFDHAYGTPHNPWDLGRNPGHLQQWLGGRDGGLPVRHLAGRGHRWLDTWAGQLVRAGGAAPELGQGEPVRGHGRILVHGHGRAHIPDRGGLRHDLPGHRRP